MVSPVQRVPVQLIAPSSMTCNEVGADSSAITPLNCRLSEPELVRALRVLVPRYLAGEKQCTRNKFNVTAALRSRDDSS